MSSELITGVVGVLGVLVGIFAERLVQRYGKLRCEVEPIRLTHIGVEGSTLRDLTPIHSLPFGGQHLKEAKARQAGVRPSLTSPDPYIHRVDYEVGIDLFNEKELQTGLRDIAIVFGGQNNGTRMEFVPHDKKTQRRERARSGGEPVEGTDAVEVINLPSREWVHYELCGTLDHKAAWMLDKCHTVEFRGCFPDRRTFVKPLTIDEDWKPKEPR